VLDAAIAKLACDPAAGSHAGVATMPAVLPARYAVAGQRFSVFSVFAQFGSAEDIALADLRIEMLFPADEETRYLFQGLAAGG
jgi:hypothetical protein